MEALAQRASLRARRRRLVQLALGLGGAIDLYVGCLGLFAPSLIPTLLDIPLRDPALARITGGEYLVAACVYALALRAPERFGPLLWVCALDQLFAVILPAVEIAAGEFPATWKTIAPIPLDLVLAILYVWAALRLPQRR